MFIVYSKQYPQSVNQVNHSTFHVLTFCLHNNSKSYMGNSTNALHVTLGLVEVIIGAIEYDIMMHTYRGAICNQLDVNVSRQRDLYHLPLKIYIITI